MYLTLDLPLCRSLRILTNWKARMIKGIDMEKLNMRTFDGRHRLEPEYKLG